LSLLSLLERGVAAASLIRAALGVCEGECQTIRSTLESCSLPPLTTEFSTLITDPIAVHVDLTLAPNRYSVARGPATYVIGTYAQARCFCLAYIADWVSCSQFFANEEGDGPKNEWRVLLAIYKGDCDKFGYFVNKTIAYPSTTRPGMPLMTTLPDGDKIKENPSRRVTVLTSVA
jgi:hypothetical protein